VAAPWCRSPRTCCGRQPKPPEVTAGPSRLAGSPVAWCSATVAASSNAARTSCQLLPGWHCRSIGQDGCRALMSALPVEDQQAGPPHVRNQSGPCGTSCRCGCAGNSRMTQPASKQDTSNSDVTQCSSSTTHITQGVAKTCKQGRVTSWAAVSGYRGIRTLLVLAAACFGAYMQAGSSSQACLLPRQHPNPFT